MLKNSSGTRINKATLKAFGDVNASMTGFGSGELIESTVMGKS